MVAKLKRVSRKKGKVTRRVIHRFRGIDRSASKAVYARESDLALAQRQLKKCEENHKPSAIDGLYKQLTPRNRKVLTDYAHYLLGTPKKK